MSNIIDRILAEVCLDDRIPDGIFDMFNNLHMEVLRENLMDNHNIALNDVKEIHNKMLEGKFPERQAYNKDGLLVTFPTPQHKQRAIQRGTHFEQNPVKAQTNVFGGQPPAAQPAPPAQPPAAQSEPSATPPATPSPQSDASQLPPSDSTPQAPTQSATPSASPSSLPASATPTAVSDKQPLAVEPSGANQSPTAPVPPPTVNVPKSSQQRAAEATVVKQMMNGDDNNQALLPTMNEQRFNELSETYLYAKRMGYQVAMKVLAEAIKI